VSAFAECYEQGILRKDSLLLGFRMYEEMAMQEEDNSPIPIEHVLETTRCVLRSPSLDDMERLLSAFTAPDFPSHVPLGQINTPDRVRNWIDGSLSRWKTGLGCTWTTVRKSDAVVVGQVTLTKRDEERTWGLAYWVHPACWGSGYATESAQRVVDFAFQELSANRIWAAAAVWNDASLKVLQKLGMAYLKDTQEGYSLDDRTIPTKEFELARSVWIERQAMR
jgi:RimJ/RimL family protein N-acetyltransferase